MSNKKRKIDVDIVIERYNKANPSKKQLDRKQLSEIIGKTTQWMSNCKGGSIPEWVEVIFKLSEIGKCKIEDFIVEINNEKQ